jgi:uncharacterized protein
MTAPANIERRAAALELRASGRRLSGYAAVFNQTTALFADQTESIRAGAFTASLAAGRDVLALGDHMPDRVLARTASKTLRLTEDDRGLHFSLDLPDTTAGRDLLVLASRGDLGGASFGFVVTEDLKTGNHRELLAVDLHEISIISAWPAYSGTSVEARSRLTLPPRLAGLVRAINILELARWG